ncbi:MAG TPA: hypothetical protein PKE57_06470 [Cellvibrionaceae bacterium]|nr:hypothetical protein [Cellvibrionaceae bacterium]HMW47707.1 hypothetical protein [Cellvibrionaceae bacterium]HMW73018.1 hypothetical protein [Cellvibrionaceae bacterium]HNG60331.1 hypothetical protein [Cellvibrionaceae bacterium]
MSEESAVQKSKKTLWVLVSLGVLVVVVVLGALQHIKPIFGLSSKDAEALTQKLNNLKVGVDISFFTQQLGEPKIKENKTIKLVSYKIIRHTDPKKEVREVVYNEYYYRSPYFYVQAVANEAGVVQLYSITARNKQFQPKIKTVLNESVQLGASVYQTLPPKLPYKVAGRLAEGPANAAYYEIFVLESALPKLEIYSTSPFGIIKDTVPLDEKQEGFLVSKFFEGTTFPITPQHDAFRKTTVINTYTAVTAEFEGIDTSPDGMNYGETKFTFGPREDQIQKLQ